MTVHLFHVRDGTLKFWFAASGKLRLSSYPRETRCRFIARWEEVHGPIKRLTRFTGWHRPSEVAATLASLERDGGTLIV